MFSDIGTLLITQSYKYFYPSTDIKATGIDPKCPLEDYAPEGEPLYTIVDDFADHQDKWFEDFLPTLEKMTENGYESGDLTEAPENWFGA